MLRAYVVHWDEATLAGKRELVERAGHAVVGAEAVDAQRAAAQLRDLRPDVLVVWTREKPGAGRTLAAALRAYPWGRDVHFVFVEGDPDLLPKTVRSKLSEVLPDAIVVTPSTLAAWLGKLDAAVTLRRSQAAARPPAG